MSKGRWIPISALNHYAYCPRRCALIHQEQAFEENRFTLEGQELHERVDQPSSMTGAVKAATSVRLWSHQRHLTGIADEIEWHDDVPYPVEFKRGKRRSWMNDDIQLCAQALCIEEMLGVSVPAGAIYHGASRRRREVYFTPELREQTIRTVEEVRSLLESNHIPAPTDHRERCPGCSLVDICLPDLYGRAVVSWKPSE